MRRNVGREVLASNAACRVATQVPDAAAREPERCATEQTLQVKQSVGPLRTAASSLPRPRRIRR